MNAGIESLPRAREIVQRAGQRLVQSGAAGRTHRNAVYLAPKPVKNTEVGRIGIQ